MAKLKAHPRPGALNELLKKKGMTQVDAKAVTKVDRKTLLKIQRGEEVKLEKLQQVATKLQVPVGHFTHPAAAADDSDAPSEPGTIMLRKLDVARLEELLRWAENIRWQLHARVPDEPARKFLEEFEQAVESFREQLVKDAPEFWDGNPSLRFQLDRLKTADDIAARLESFADHGVALLGADYLFWDCSSTDSEQDEQFCRITKYSSSRTVLLSVEPGGTQSRRAPVSQGELPPAGAPNTPHQKTTVFVNGRETTLDDCEIPF